MRARLIDGSERAGTWLLAFEAGDDVLAALRDFAREHAIGAASFQAIGAFRSATVAFYDVAAQRYEDRIVDEQLEVCSLLGNVTRFDGDVRIHAHVVLGRRDLTTLGGHLVKAEVNPTLELFLQVSDATLDRTLDPPSALPLL